MPRGINPFVARARRRAARVQPKPASPPPAEPKPEPKPEPSFATDGIVETVSAPPVTDEAPERLLPMELDPESPMAPLPESDGKTERIDQPEPVAETAIVPPENYLGPRGAETVREPEPEKPKRGRGRPRPQETIDRDNAVLELLRAHTEGVSKNELAASLGEKEQQVYSSLRQLSKDGRARTAYVKDVSGYRWFAVGE